MRLAQGIRGRDKNPPGSLEIPFVMSTAAAAAAAAARSK